MAKEKGYDIDEIGDTLNVRYVLEGSLHKSGNRLRISAQLINVGNGFHVWSEEYDQEMVDVFDIRDNISMKIVDALKVKLLDNEREAIKKRYTENVEAFNLYTQGRFYWYNTELWWV